jgi:hypothetical protein
MTASCDRFAVVVATNEHIDVAIQYIYDGRATHQLARTLPIRQVWSAYDFTVLCALRPDWMLFLRVMGSIVVPVY